MNGMDNFEFSTSTGTCQSVCCNAKRPLLLLHGILIFRFLRQGQFNSNGGAHADLAAVVQAAAVRRTRSWDSLCSVTSRPTD